MKIIEYVFYADCHGLCSLTKLDPKIFYPLSLSCISNEQRRPVYGIIEITEDEAKHLLRLNPKTSLKRIKKMVYKLPINHKSRFIRHLEMIPNDILDPMYTRRRNKKNESN